MPNDFDLKMFETKAELEMIKEGMKEIQKQNNPLKNEIAFKKLIETVNEVQSKVNVLSTNFKEIQQTTTALSSRVSNHDDNFSELNENLRKLDEKLNKYDTTLSLHNEIPAKQNETTQVLSTNENNLEKQAILLLGGVDGKNYTSLLMLENNGQNWKQLNTKLPYSIHDHGAQFLNNNLYIFGGFTKNNKELNWTYKLSKSLRWEKMADMNERRAEISNSSVILNNQIWVCGGAKGKETLKSVEMYDPRTNKWKYMKEMNEYRSVTAAAVVNNKIFCSGLDIPVEYYDPFSDVWTSICSMPQNIWGHGAVEINGNFIIIGGWDNTNAKDLNTVLLLDTTDNNAKWIEKPSMSIPRTNLSIAKIDGKVFVCGGEVGIAKSTDSVEIFDGEVWRNGPKMPRGRYSAPAVAIPMKFARSLS